MNFSSEFFIEDGEEDAFDRFIKKIFKDKANDAIIGISLVLSLLFSVGIFYTYTNNGWGYIFKNN